MWTDGRQSLAENGAGTTGRPTVGFRVCFVAGTPIVGLLGSKPIEEYKSYEEFGDGCDTLVSRDEFNEDGLLTIRRVLRRFERVGPVLDVTADGKVIGTTHEHPVFVKGKGWTKAHELRVGDRVRLMGPGWATVARPARQASRRECLRRPPSRSRHPTRFGNGRTTGSSASASPGTSSADGWLSPRGTFPIP